MSAQASAEQTKEKVVHQPKLSDINIEAYRNVIAQSREVYIKKNMSDMEKAIEESQDEFLLIEQ